MKKEKSKHRKKTFLWTGRCYLLVFVNLLLVVVFTFAAYNTLGANVNKYLGYKLDEAPPSIKHYIEEVDYDYPENDIKILQAEQSRRLNHLEDYCKGRNKTQWHANNMYYWPGMNLAVCLQPKAASTDLTRLLAQMMGLDPMDNDFQRIKNCDDVDCLVKITASNREQILSNVTTAVLFVREPMERLVAAYQRILNHPFVSQEIYDELTKPILNTLRFNNKNKMPDTPDKAWSMGYKMSFPELVNGFLLPYELNDSELDDYWRPQTDNCNVCVVNYTFIGKVATFDDDMAVLMDELGQNNTVKHRDRTDTFDVLKHFTGIDIDKRSKLYKLYQNDYAAFRYQYPTYLGI